MNLHSSYSTQAQCLFLVQDIPTTGIESTAVEIYFNSSISIEKIKANAQSEYHFSQTS